MSTRNLPVICLLLISVLALPLAAWAWSGKVIGISDGDTITVLHDSHPEKIRLYGIDCPEKRQPFGKRAKQFTADFSFGKVVEVQPVANDRYGRTVAFIYAGGNNLNEELIGQGLAWIYLRYCKEPICIKWLGLQSDEKIREQGLWQTSDAIPPWEFRKRKRK